ncbi:MAG TPA: hypothetical protein VIM79_22735 [Niastella sp.]
MHKFFYSFFLCSLLFFTTTQSQVTVSTIKNPSTGYGSNLVFPYIKSANQKTAKAINAYLQFKMLDNSTVITNPQKIFFNRQYINTDTLSQSGYSELSYKVVMNTSRVLSIQFDVEATGAYSYYYKEYHSFNTQTGQAITANTIFNAEGLKYLRKHLIKERKKLIAKFMEEDGGDVKDSAYITETYVECNKSADADKIFVLPKSIMFYKERCFPHHSMPYETDLNITIPVKQLEKYLTGYGKTLLL